jgi:hypothetical protein
VPLPAMVVLPMVGRRRLQRHQIRVRPTHPTRGRQRERKLIAWPRSPMRERKGLADARTPAYFTVW